MREDVDTVAVQARDPKLEELVRRLVEAVHPQRIYLFGSRARGDARPDSDYDILLLSDQDEDDLPALRQGAYQSLWGFGMPVDVIVMNDRFFDRRRVVVASLPGTVAREGKIVYAGPQALTHAEEFCNFVIRNLPPEITVP
jgi:predicted nucleotidyltransferase